jgi:glycosyltransferase involved in cell wall biosynthesis
VVASRVAGVVEQVEDGVTGLIVSPGDPDALADALAGAAADPAWREAAGRAGRERVRACFSVGAAAAGLAAVLRELAAPATVGKSRE